MTTQHYKPSLTCH